jgi:ABC-2 type transport system ATP-binding protein
MSEHIVEVRNLVRRFGNLIAVDSISFSVDKGEIFGFLGPNGAGKTTTINVLCTLLKPSSGEARLNNFDVAKEPNGVRQSIGLVFQDPSLDERLTARENLEFHARIYNLPREGARARIQEVLRMVELSERQNDIVRTFSGGMKRRLEIARGLLHYPKVLFLDEPTLGLDPQTRSHIWEYIHSLRVKEEITIFLTTHYMEEAENCDRIAIIDHGKIIALDTPENLKKQVGGDAISMKTVDNDRALLELKEKYGIAAQEDGDGIRFEVSRGEEFIPHFIVNFSVEINSISLRRPTLEDVFLKLTGRAIREESVGAIDQMRQVRRAWTRR